MKLTDILKTALAKGASDIHLKVGNPPIFRIDGSLRALKDAPRLSPEVSPLPGVWGGASPIVPAQSCQVSYQRRPQAAGTCAEGTQRLLNFRGVRQLRGSETGSNGDDTVSGCQRLQLFDPRELLLAAYVEQELHVDLFAVQVTVEVEYVNFQQRLAS